jgi:hypothetical protein
MNPEPNVQREQKIRERACKIWEDEDLADGLHENH